MPLPVPSMQSSPITAASSASSAAPALLRPRALARTSRSLSLGSTLFRGEMSLSKPLRLAGSGGGSAQMLPLRKGGGGAAVAALADRPLPPSSPPPPPSASSASPVSFDLPLGSDAPAGCRLSVKVSVEPEGGASSVVEIALSGLPSGRALLHWGVLAAPAAAAGAEGGGRAWRLPAGASRPRGTLNYKNRALQTPLGAAAAATGKAAAEGAAEAEAETTSSSSSSSAAAAAAAAASSQQRLTLSFPAAERASALVFVLKDSGTGTWLSPPGGGNFEVPLLGSDASEAAANAAAAASAAAGTPPPSPKSTSSSSSSSFAALVDADLVSAWAYATWQAEGAPPRGGVAAAEGERAAAAQLRDLVSSAAASAAAGGGGAAAAAARGRVAALRLAAASSAAFEAFWASGLPSSLPPPGGAGADPWAAALARAPQDLVAVEAYLLWERAGRPEGADFGGAARRRLAARLRAGEAVEALRRELTGGGEPERGEEGEERKRRERREERERRERDEEEERRQRDAAAASAAAASAAVAVAVEEEEKKKEQQEPPSPPPPPAKAEEKAAPEEGQQQGASSDAAAAATLGAPADGVPSLDPLSLIKGTSSSPRSSSSSSSPLTPVAHACPLAPLEDAASRDEACVWHRAFGLGGGYTLLAAVRVPPPLEAEESSASALPAGLAARITLTTDLPDPVSLHWGVRPSRKARRGNRGGKGGDWLPPPAALLPAGSAEAPGGGAAETPLRPCADADCLAANVSGDPVRLRRVSVDVPLSLEQSGDVPAALVFVLRADDGTKWWRDGGGNFAVPLATRGRGDGAESGSESDDGRSSNRVYESCAFEDELSCDIVGCELGSGGWTLMHRFNRATDLLERELRRAEKVKAPPSGGDAAAAASEAAAAALSTVFVWLRYSAARHLTWQRSYNTQPRLLGEAQQRLSRALAAAHGQLRGEAQEWARASLSCVGRGQGAQAVRDEILNVMHRHKISEKAGTW